MNVFGLRSVNYSVRGYQGRSSNFSAQSSIFQGSPVSKEAAAAGNHHVTLKSGYLYSAANPSSGQELHMNYDETSSEDDPVMLVTGRDMRGNEFSKKIHLNELDPENATPAEMTALSVHLREQGDKSVQTSSGIPLMATGSQYDLNSKMNFKQYYNDWISTLENSGIRHNVDIYKSELERYLFYYAHNKSAT